MRSSAEEYQKTKEYIDRFEQILLGLRSTQSATPDRYLLGCPSSVYVFGLMNALLYTWRISKYDPAPRNA